MVIILQESISTPDTSQENTKEKKKKEKPVVMSLDEFRMTGPTEAEGINDLAKREKRHSVTGLDDFLEWPDSTAATDVTESHVKSQGHSKFSLYAPKASHK